MINMDELKPILEGLGDTISTDTLAAIAAIDKPVEDQSEKIASLEADLAAQKQAYRDTFFSGLQVTNSDQNQTLPDEDPDNEEITTFEQLFGEGVK